MGQDGRPGLVVGVLGAVFLVSLAGFLAVLFMADPFKIAGVNMAPRLEPGDRILTWNIDDTVGRGDIVAFRRRDDELHGKETIVSRIVAVEGDEVAAQGGQLVVNGEPANEPYLSDEVSTDDFGPVQVPEGEMFVLGDNRLNSIDSRIFGPVPTANVRGTLALTNVPVDWALLGLALVSGLGAVIAVVIERRRPSSGLVYVTTTTSRFADYD